VAGVLTAENQATALRLLDEKSLFPVSIEEGGESSKNVLTGGRRRVKLAHLTTFYSQMADLLKAGVPLLRSLDVIGRQRTNPVLSEVVKEVKEDVAGGSTLGDAMEKHPSTFSHLQVSMVRAGESGGFLEEVLARIAVFLTRQDSLRKKLVGAMIYPMILITVAILLVTGLMTLAVPKLRPLMREESFNVCTNIVFGVSDALRYNYMVILLVVGVIVGTIVWYAKTDFGRRQWANFQLKGPVFGRVVTMVNVCRFCRILGTMLKNGVPILQALQISKDSAGNEILSEEIEKAHENVKRGESLAKPLDSSGLFPPDVIDMIAVAEEGNTLDGVLVQIADTNEERTAAAIDVAVRMLEPLLLVAMAGAVLFIAIALLLPILSMAGGAR
jgi:general secretion pathway protein F/type IV pilus assembly protein PilC